MLTVTRRPRMHALPPMTAGTKVMRVKGIMTTSPYVTCTTWG